MRVLLIVGLACVGCGDVGPVAEVLTVEPAVAEIGSLVTVRGMNFRERTERSRVLVFPLDEVEGSEGAEGAPEPIVLTPNVESWSDQEVTFRVPLDMLGTSFDSRSFGLHVERSTGISNCTLFEVVLPPDPVIEAIDPPVAEVAHEITITGTGFGESGNVFFSTEAGPESVEPLSWAPTEIIVMVPDVVTDGVYVETMLGLRSRVVAFEVADPDAPTLSLIQRTLFTGRCALGPCHGAGLMGGLSLVDGESWENLVGLPGVGNPDMLRVDPFSPDTSFLIDKLVNDPPSVGERMPQGGPYLSEPEIELVRTWIARGALDD